MSSWCDYKIGNIIGKGSFGVVYLGKKNHTNQKYAIKKINLQNMDQYTRRNLVNEIKLLASHNCPFIIRFITSFLHLENLCIVTEYAQKGDLYMLIKDKETKFTEDEIWHYFIQICMGIKYLHKNNIVHRDIKSANIFIDSNNNIKLGDFGIIKILKAYMMYTKTQVGTPIYMGPEIFKRERYNTKIDIWSLGCILHELITLKPAFTAKNFNDLKCKILAGKIDIPDYTYSTELKNLLEKLLSVNPRLRPSIEEVLDNIVVKEYVSAMNIGMDNFKLRQVFNENCIIPRKINDWNYIIKKYSPTVPIKLPNIHIIKYDKNEVTRIDAELATLNNEITEFKKLVGLKLRQINILQCKKRSMMHEQI